MWSHTALYLRKISSFAVYKSILVAKKAFLLFTLNYFLNKKYVDVYYQINIVYYEFQSLSTTSFNTNRSPIKLFNYYYYY